MPEIKEVHHTHDQPVKILLQKSKGGYNWEIHVSGKSVAEILPIIRDANAKLAKECRGA